MHAQSAAARWRQQGVSQVSPAQLRSISNSQRSRTKKPKRNEEGELGGEQSAAQGAGKVAAAAAGADAGAAASSRSSISAGLEWNDSRIYVESCSLAWADMRNTLAAAGMSERRKERKKGTPTELL